ncbi:MULTISPECIES: AAA family ATPase [unclassified Mesorhizobium]|nr:MULTISPECIES: AAA family ATPase [unclassified Mesorhizobium]
MEFLSYYDMCNLPEPEWLVHGLIQKRSTAVMFGKSNAFKSFLAIDIGLSVDTGQDWHDNEVSHGGVLFVATEGANGVGRLRIPGWYDHHRIEEENRRAFLYPKEIRLDVADDVTALIARMKQDFFALVVIDIFGGSMAGSEIEDKTARAWVHGIQRILRETGASILTVAHTGWQDETRARMHTHFWGSFDTRLRVEGDKEAMTATLTVERHKDADSSGSWGFRLVQSHGTLVPEIDASVTKSAAKPKKLSGENRAALNALDDAIAAHGVMQFGEDWPPCKVVHIDQWRKYVYLLSPGDTADTKRQGFYRAKKALHNGGHIAFYDDHVWKCAG